MAAAARAITGREELARWYSLHLRPMVARAAEQRVIDPARAAAFELTMAELIRPQCLRARGRQTRPDGANTNGR